MECSMDVFSLQDRRQRWSLLQELKGYISDTSNLHYDDLVEAEAYNSAYYNCLDEIEEATPIIEADKSESEKT